MDEIDRGFCVYIHTDMQGVPFYVGSGRKTRAMSKESCNTKENGTGRGKDYSKKVSTLAYDYKAVIVRENLTKAESINLERELYIKHKLTINKSTPASMLELDSDYFTKFVKYDKNSETGLVWNTNREGNGKIKENNVAGSVMHGRYCTIKIEKRQYLCHRIVALLNGMDISGKVVDHVDGNMFNNDIENLRVVSQAENSRNRKVRNNKSGVVGVILQKGQNGSSEKWRALWAVDGRKKSKAFAVSLYGYDEAFRLACEARASAIEELNAQGLGYTEYHGTIPK